MLSEFEFLLLLAVIALLGLAVAAVLIVGLLEALAYAAGAAIADLLGRRRS